MDQKIENEEKDEKKYMATSKKVIKQARDALSNDDVKGALDALLNLTMDTNGKKLLTCQLSINLHLFLFCFVLFILFLIQNYIQKTTYLSITYQFAFIFILFYFILFLILIRYHFAFILFYFTLFLQIISRTFGAE